MEVSENLDNMLDKSSYDIDYSKIHELYNIEVFI